MNLLRVVEWNFHVWRFKSWHNEFESLFNSPIAWQLHKRKLIPCVSVGAFVWPVRKQPDHHLRCFSSKFQFWTPNLFQQTRPFHSGWGAWFRVFFFFCVSLCVALVSAPMMWVFFGASSHPRDWNKKNGNSNMEVRIARVKVQKVQSGMKTAELLAGRCVFLRFCLVVSNSDPTLGQLEWIHGSIDRSMDPLTDPWIHVPFWGDSSERNLFKGYDCKSIYGNGKFPHSRFRYILIQ